MAIAALFATDRVPSCPTPPAIAALLDAAGPLEGMHALVIGHDTLEVMCGLIGRGCGAAAEMSLDGRLPAEPAEIVLVPRADSLNEASAAISLARRVLLPCGRIVLRDAQGTLAGAIAQLLRAAGFSAVRSRVCARGTIVSADWPMFGVRPVREMRHA